MAIFRRKIERVGYATIAIEANDKKEAEDILEDWMYDDKNYDELCDVLNSRCIDFDTPINGYGNIDEYNRANHTDDFTIFGKAKQKEELYDIYFLHDDDPNKTDEYKNLTMSKLIDKLREKNHDYLIKPTMRSPSVNQYHEASKRKAHILMMTIEKRRK